MSRLCNTLFCFGILFVIGSVPSAALSAESSKVGKGYFWYEDPEKQDEPKYEEPEQVRPQPPAGPKPFSVEWVTRNYEKLKNKAIDDPTPENVANFKYLTRFMVDQSQRFAEVNKQVVSLDPYLDEENRMPTAAWANIASSRQLDRNKDQVFKYMAGQGGLWVFIDTPEKCPACKEYSSTVIKLFAQKHGFDLKTIYVRSPEGHVAAERLKLKGTPTTVYVHPATNNYFVVSQGLLSAAQVGDRLIVAGNAHNLFPKDVVELANPYSKDLLDGRELREMGVDPNDPSAVMKKLRDRISGTSK